MRQQSSTLRIFRGLRGALLDVIIESERAANERYFHDDLRALDAAALREEQRKLQLRLMLTPRAERERAESAWFYQRLQRVEELLKPAPLRGGRR